MDVLSFVNGITQTSFQTEISAKIDEVTDANVEIASFYDAPFNDSNSPDFNVPIHPLNATSRFDIRAYRKLRALLDDFDILHTHYNSVGSLGRIASIGKDIKIVNTEHADHQYYSFPQRFVNVPSFKFVDEMVFNSKNTKDSLPWYEQLFINKNNAHVIYNGVDIEWIDKAKSLSKPKLPEGKIILSACRMVSVKNLETLIRSFHFLKNKHNDVSLVLIGDGPERERLERLCDELEIVNSVYFLGYLNREQVYSAMHRADVFAVPSYHEGFCNAAVEAMTCGLPIVASDIAVLREVIASGGVFADPKSISNFKNTLINVLYHHNSKDIGKKGKSYSRKNYSIEQTARNYFSLYQNTI